MYCELNAAEADARRYRWLKEHAEMAILGGQLYDTLDISVVQKSMDFSGHQITVPQLTQRPKVNLDALLDAWMNRPTPCQHDISQPDTTLVFTGVNPVTCSSCSLTWTLTIK